MGSYGGGGRPKNTAISSSRTTAGNESLEKCIKNFRKMDFYGTMKNDDSILLPENETKTF